MTRNHLRRRFSFAVPALVFLFFSALETVEVTGVAQSLVALSTADVQPTAPAFLRPCMKSNS